MGCSYFLPMLKRLDFSFFSWRFVLWNHFLILLSNLSTLFFMVSAYDIFSYPKIMNIFSWLSFSKLGYLLEGVLLYLFMLQSTIHVEFNFVYAVRYESWFLIFFNIWLYDWPRTINFSFSTVPLCFFQKQTVKFSNIPVFF